MTSSAHESSLAQLESEAARNRAELRHTIEALQNRLSPGAIKADVRHYVQDKKEGLFRSLEQRARQNPLQAVAIAGAAAYPLWRIITRMPAPLLLIGAGLALTRAAERDGMNGSGDSQGLVATARTRLGEATDAAKQKFEQASDTVQQTVRETMQSAREAAEEASSRVSAIGTRAAESADAVTAKLSGTFSPSEGGGAPARPGITSGASEMASAGYQRATEAAHHMGAQLQQVGQRAEQTLAETVRHHPVMVGAIGLVIGAVVAAVLPLTRQEEQILGEPAGELKRKAQDLASENFDAVKETASEIYEEAVADVKEHGLSSEGVKQAAETIREGAKDAISRTRDAPLGQSASLEHAPKSS
jgi:hypothetical protein